MKWFKKIVRAILNLLPLFAVVFITTSNVSALQYPIDTIPIAPSVLQFRKVQDYQTGEDVYLAFSKNRNFYISSTKYTGDFPSGFEFPHTWRFSGDYDVSSNTCSIPSFVSNNQNYYADGVSQFYYSGSNVYGYTVRKPALVNSYDDFDSFDLNNTSESPFDLTVPLYSQIPESSLYISRRSVCNIQNQNYKNIGIADSGVPEWNFSSLVNIPLVNNRLEYNKDEPYTYQFNYLYINGSQRTDDGLVYSKSGIKMSEIFKVKIPTFSMLNINFDDFTDAGSWLSPDDTDDSVTSERVYTFDIGGSISFDEDYSLGSSAGVVLDVSNYYNPYLSLSTMPDIGSFDINGKTVHMMTSVQSSQLCDLTEYHIDNGDDENKLDFICHYNPISVGAYSEEINFRYMNIALSFNGNGTGSWNFDEFLNTTGDYTFKDFYFITNNDSTPSGWSGSSYGTGGNISAAPGASISNSDSNGEIDFLASLTSMFSFNFINPFAGLFNLFSDQSSCANIPIVAGMIHSESSEVCPWFDSTTRNIVTPVLGMASIMLLFGFAVRWLGSSSGNLFEDSGTIESPGYSATGGTARWHGWRRKG